MRIAAAALLLSLAISLEAQEKFVESIEVRVVNVDVIVTDRAGNPVHGLKRSDFELFENGKPQTITNFYEVRPDEELAAHAVAAQKSNEPEPIPPPESRARHIVVFIDDYSIEQSTRARVLK